MIHTQSQKFQTRASNSGVRDALAVQTAMLAKTVYAKGNTLRAQKLSTGLSAMLIKDHTTFMVQSHEGKVKLSAKAECRPTFMFWLLVVLGVPGGTLLVMYLYAKQRDMLKYNVDSIVQRTIIDLK